MLGYNSNNMKWPWRNYLILLAAVASACSVGLLLHILLSQKIRTRGIETLQINPPTIVSRFDLSDVTNRVPEAASKIVEGASRIVEEVSSQATAISEALEIIPTQVTLGMDQVCWHASKVTCTPIWKGPDEWFPSPLAQFFKLDNHPVYLVLTKCNIRTATAVSLSFYLAVISVFISGLVARLWLRRRNSSAGLEKEKKLENHLFRHMGMIVSAVGFCIVVPLILNILVLYIIDMVLGKFTFGGLTRVPGNLSMLFVISLFLVVTSLVCLVLFHRAATKIPLPPSQPRP